MEKLSLWIQTTLNINSDLQKKILASIIIVLILWIIQRLIIKLLWRSTEKTYVRYRWRKASGYVLAIVGIFLLGVEWFKGFQSVATFLGLLSAGIAIALKDIVADIAGWIFIILRHPFDVGDRIQIGEHAGDVVDIRAFEFTINEIGNWVAADQSTGRIIHIPNGKVLSETLANYSKEFKYIWNEIPVLVTFESDWEKAKEILRHVAGVHTELISESAKEELKKVSGKFFILYSKLTPIVYTSVDESGVLLTIRYLCRPKNRRSTEQAIWEDILHEFAKHDDIDFAYPTERFYNNKLEGKPSAGRVNKNRTK